MGTIFWVKRFVVILFGAFAVITVAQWLKGHALDYALTQGAVWGLVSASIFTVARFFQARRGQHCALCKDTPELRDGR